MLASLRTGIVFGDLGASDGVWRVAVDDIALHVE